MKDPSNIWQYPACYSDRRGAEATAVPNDGEDLSMTVRGVTLAGWMFDDFNPRSAPADEVASRSDLNLEPFALARLSAKFGLRGPPALK